MVLLETPICEFGLPAKDFSLMGVDGNRYTLQNCMGETGILVMFLCNHCPYVKSIIDRIIRDTDELKELGVNSVAIMSNDTEEYPEDSFENMRRLSQYHKFNFPYLLDDTQQVGKAYGAICTPDFFGYNTGYALQYRGRLDASTTSAAEEGAKRELFDAMTQIAQTGHGPVKQIASMGCSIKWKA